MCKNKLDKAVGVFRGSCVKANQCPQVTSHTLATISMTQTEYLQTVGRPVALWVIGARFLFILSLDFFFLTAPAAPYFMVGF